MKKLQNIRNKISQSSDAVRFSFNLNYFILNKYDKVLHTKLKKGKKTEFLIKQIMN